MSVVTHILRKALKQKAVYWAPSAPDGYGGRQYASPVEINCRWQDGTKTILSREGEEVVSIATVWVDRDLQEGGMLWLGELSNLTSSQQADPTTLSDAYTIRRFEKMPEYGSNTRFLRKVYL